VDKEWRKRGGRVEEEWTKSGQRVEDEYKMVVNTEK